MRKQKCRVVWALGLDRVTGVISGLKESMTLNGSGGQEEPPASQVPRAVRVASLLSEGEDLSGDDQGDEDEDDYAYEHVPK